MPAPVRMTPSTDNRYPDEETRKIAEEMEKEGKTTAFKLPEKPTFKADVNEDDEDGELTPEQKAAKDAEAKAKVDEAAKAEVDTKAKDEADAKAKADAEAAGKKTDEKPSKGDPKEVLIVAQKRDIKRLEGEIADLQKKLTTQEKTGSEKAPDTQAKIDAATTDLEKIVDSIVQANDGVDPALVKSILEAAMKLTSGGNKLPDDLVAKIDKIAETEKVLQEQEKEQEVIQAETTRFNDEFKQEIAANEDIKKVVAEVGMTMDELKDKIFGFVYSEDGSKYAGLKPDGTPKFTLTEVFTHERSRFVPTHKKSAEAGRGGTSQGGTVEAKMPSAEEIAAMSPEEFEKFSNNLAKTSRSKVTRRGQPI